MDKDNSGFITVCDIKNIYDVSQNPEFLEGQKTKEEILLEFLDNFEGARGNDDGRVGKKEWEDYYSDIAMSCPSENYFCRVLEQAWGISEDEGSAAHKEQLAYFLSQIRLRLLEMSNASTEEYVLRKVFNQFDTNESGTITIDELAGMIASLKLSCERKYLYGILKVIDINDSGSIEFEEFLNYVVNNPYKL